MKKKEEPEKKAEPVMKRLAREMSATEIKTVAGGKDFCIQSGDSAHFDPDVYPRCSTGATRQNGYHSHQLIVS